MGGLAGLDLTEARATAVAYGAPDGPDLVDCLAAIEAGALKGSAKRAKFEKSARE